MKHKIKKVLLFLGVVFATTFLFSCGKKNNVKETISEKTVVETKKLEIETTENKVIETTAESKKEMNNGTELVYDDIDKKNIMYFPNTENYLIKNVKNNHNFIVYIPNYNGTDVKIYDIDENEIENNIKRYSEEHGDNTIDKNVYTVYLNDGVYDDSLEYKITLPNAESYFLIKDFDKVNTISFEIVREERENVKFKGTVDFSTIYNSKEDIKNLSENDIAIVDKNGRYVPYKLEGDNLVELTKFSDIYSEVDIYKTIDFADYYRDNKEEVTGVIKNSLMESGFLENFIMTTYAVDIGAAVKIGENDVLVNIDEDGNFKIKTIIHIDENHEVDVILVCKAYTDFYMAYKDSKNFRDLLSLKDLDFMLNLKIINFEVTEKYSALASDTEEKSNTPQNVFDNDELEGYHNAKSFPIVGPLKVPLGMSGFFVQATIPFMAGYKIAGELSNILKFPMEITVGVKKDHMTKQLEPYYNLDYNINCEYEAKLFGSFFAGIGIKGTAFAISDSILSVSAGGDGGINAYGECKADITLSYKKGAEKVDFNGDIEGNAKIDFDVIIYAEAILDAENIPIVNLFVKEPVKGRIENMICNINLFDTNNLVTIASDSNANVDLSIIKEGEERINGPTLILNMIPDYVNLETQTNKKYTINFIPNWATKYALVATPNGGIDISNTSANNVKDMGENVKQQLINLLLMIKEEVPDKIKTELKENYKLYEKESDYEKFEKAYMECLYYCIQLYINNIEEHFRESEIKDFSFGLDCTDNFDVVNDKNGNFSRIICIPKLYNQKERKYIPMSVKVFQ